MSFLTVGELLLIIAAICSALTLVPGRPLRDSTYILALGSGYFFCRLVT